MIELFVNVTSVNESITYAWFSVEAPDAGLPFVKKSSGTGFAGFVGGFEFEWSNRIEPPDREKLGVAGTEIAGTLVAVGADAAAAGSFFVFSHTKTGGVLINYPSQEELTLAFSKLATEWKA